MAGVETSSTAIDDPLAKDTLNKHTQKNNVDTEEPTLSKEIDDTEMPFSDDILRQLSKQLEYYFSVENLSKDTYLRTLRELNDGYVPASILANFAKVRSLLENRLDVEAVVKAASDFSTYLEVVHVDKDSNKKVVETKNLQTIIAVGPKDSKPIEIPSSIQQQPTSVVADTSPAANTIQNTVILREVGSGVNEDDIRELFNFEKCPSIQVVWKDVANCWFVTLNTSSRDDMVHVMFALRSKTLKGEPVKARLKAGSVPPPGAPSSPGSYSSRMVYSGDRNLPYDIKKYGGKNNKGKYYDQDRRNVNGGKKNRKGNRGSNGSISHNHRETSSKEEELQKHETGPTTSNPPQFMESHFPALHPSPLKNTNDTTGAKSSKSKSSNKNKQQAAEDDDEEDVSKTPLSDAASTATTSTSSSVVDSGLATKGGYAAALLKNPPSGSKVASFKSLQKEMKPQSNEPSDDRRVQQRDAIPNEVGRSQSSVEKVEEKKVTGWGGGRSFADILK